MEKEIYFKTLQLIGNKGIKFTTEDLAAELATSKRTIYTFFSGKDELIEKTIDFVFDEIQNSDKAILEDDTIPINEKVALYFKNMPEAYNLSSIVRHMDELKRHYPQLWKHVNKRLEGLWDGLIELLDDGIKKNEINPVNLVILRLIMNETMKKILDYDFYVNNNLSFDSALESLSEIIIFGVLKR